MNKAFNDTDTSPKNKTPLIYSHFDYTKRVKLREKLEHIFNELEIDNIMGIRDFVLAEMIDNFLCVTYNTKKAMEHLGYHNVVDNKVNSVMADKAFAWLEKKGEQNHTDNIEPKFKVDDWIVNKGNSYLIGYIDYEQRRYLFEIGGYTHKPLNWEHIENADNKYHLWTIQDAKDGDVLVTDNGLVFIYNEYLEEQQWPFAYGGINLYGRFNICNGLLPFTHQKVTPATKEQRDLLFKKMHEAGYEWNAEKKELKKIEQNNVLSEEELIQAKKDAYNDALDKIEYNDENPTFDDGWSAAIWYMKKRNAQTVWKPSNRQLKGIECAIETLRHQLNVGDKRLNSLYDDLKKLKEE